RDRIMEGGHDAERRIAKRRQIRFLRQIARRDEFHALRLESAVVEGFDEGEGRRTGRQEGEDRLGATVFETQHDGAEIRRLQRRPAPPPTMAPPPASKVFLKAASASSPGP